MVLLAASLSVQAAGIGLGLVRLVYNQQEGQASIPVRNTSASPYLVSTRVSVTPDGHEPTPFVVSPTLVRLEGGAEGTVRVINNAQTLPADRESVFYVTVAGIPSSNPLARGDTQGFVNGGVKFAYGNTIKLFYRPEGLPSSASEAAKAVRFTRDGGNVKVENPSPYYVTFRSLTINGQRVTFSKTLPDMMAPFSSMTVPAGRAFPIKQAGKVDWSVIVDMGAIVNASGELQ